MNFHKPRQIKDGPNAGKWHYTVFNDNQKTIRPEGYCAQDCPGHDTPEDACEHQKAYLLDQSVQVGETTKIKERCLVCTEWTTRVVSVGYGIPQDFRICGDHDDRAELERLFSVGESFGSY